MEIKQWIKKKICRYFGHVYFEEVFAERDKSLMRKELPKGKKQKLYRIKKRFLCDRCGHIFYEYKSDPMHRTDLLKKGWFFTDKDYRNGK